MTRRATIAIWILLLGLAAGCSPHRGAWRAGGSQRDEARQTRLASWRVGPRLLRVGLEAGLDTVQVRLAAPAELHWLRPGRGPVGDGTAAAAGLWRFTPDPETGSVTALAPDGRGWKVRERECALLLRPVDPDSSLIYGDRPYDGDLLLSVRDGGLTVVNAVAMETYLRGVVPWEIGRPGESGLAALEAQAVAARTYTVSHLGEREALGFDVWTDTRDQVYRGLEGVDPWCDRAIAGTAGLVLRHRGREISAYYSSTCGGTTSAIEEVWSRPPRSYLESHSDRDRSGRANCAESSQFTWAESWDVAALNRILGTSLPAYLDWVEASGERAAWAGEVFRPGADGADPRTPGAVRDVLVLDRTTSGRVATLEIRTETGTYLVRGDRTRWVLAPAAGRFSILRSAWFEVEPVRDREGSLTALRATGRGFGHGIGMCQAGALGMARRGASSREILAHYYPGARLETAW